MPDSQPLTVLFDLDLTLLSIEGDRDIRSQALAAVTGVPDPLSHIDDAGRTDRWLVEQASSMWGFEVDGLFERYEAAYTAELRVALAELPCSAFPGAAPLLEALAARPETRIGVSTGNLRANAVLRVAHAELTRYFTPLHGGFGDRHADRADIVRAGCLECGHVEGERLVVVGDTVHEVRAALDAGAAPVAVATGHASEEQLRAAGASTVLPDLDDCTAALEAITGDGG
ncbi:MAG: HAD hydrolase-like protein [Dehalococcoidia bacterium]|nr:HAD hydrolase-like protein [Dehalococcoidia bacterium]